MNKEEVNNLPWWGEEKFALVSTKTKNMFFASDNEQDCRDVLIKMTPKHPLYKELILVSRL